MAAMAVIMVGVGVATTAAADPYRLRGNVYAESQPDTPAGLLTFDATSDMYPWLSAEALVWLGAGDDTEGDAMVVSVILRDPDHRGEAQLGRFLVIPGAVRPLHLDGARVRANAPAGIAVEGFGGVPVVPELGADAYDWAIGGRASRRLGDWGAAGVAYLQRRDAGRLDDHELGVDAGYSHADWLDIGARAAFDLQDPGPSDVMVSASARRGAWRYEVFGSHRSPARLLPATSLFTVLGDIATQKLGVAARWRAAPRLDLDATAAARRYDDDYGMELRARALLRLDDRGAGATSVELRREDAPDGSWTGARLAVRAALPHALTASSELELAIPDDGGDRGSVWPWALAALAYRIDAAWHVAAAIEVSASPEYDYRVDGIARVSRAWGQP